MEDYTTISGSWFPTGYHGHFREKARPEVINFYRQRAKPVPPSKFLNRSKVRSDQHLFSRHDNRHSHATSLGDLEMYFEMGLGKGKPPAHSQQWKDTSNLLRWTNDASASSKNNSTYQTSFRSPSVRTWTPITCNDTEPIHGRSGLNLYRRQLKQTVNLPTRHTAPLLAWNEPDQVCTAKPAVGNPQYRREQSDLYYTRLKKRTISVDTVGSLLS